MAEQEFKILDGVRRGASSGEMLTGKQVVRPLRFFVSEASQHSIACIMISGADLTCSESQDSALRIVAALRSVVESRLEELKKDKATRVACSDWSACLCMLLLLLFLIRSLLLLFLIRSPGDPTGRCLRH